MLKRVAVMLLCLMIVFIATFGFVVGVVAVPTIYSYAEVIDDDPIYVPLRDPSDLVISFQAFCKSRDLTIEGSIADAVTTFTTGAFNSACNTIGINIPQLQAEIKAEYDQTGKATKFLYSATGIDAMNRIFAQFLQDNELEVGDQVNDEVVYSGYYFQDDEGYGCFAYVISWYSEDTVIPSKIGTPYLYDYDDFIAATPINLTRHYKNFAYTVVSSYSGSSARYHYYLKYNNSNNFDAMFGGTDYSRDPMYKAFPAVAYNTANNKFVLGAYKWSTDNYTKYFKPLLTINVNDQQSTSFNIYLTTNNSVINNNNYEGDTIINNEGDVIVEPDPVPPPGGNDPGWDIGGGDGTATDGDGNTWNIQFPDFQLPDLNIDWSINGLGEKFPFSIPFDLVALVTVLNAEPQAPRFEGTVNFGFTTWNYDINLQQFDSVAQACRIAELLLLVVGLILVTRSIIKG